MRIIAGTFRGRVLQAPKGSLTRPTTDRVREALMSALVSLRCGFEEAVVLDAFAGSGALGLESLSRQASYVEFFENNTQAQRVLRSNISALNLDESCYALQRRDFLKSPPRGERVFDVVFLDPPYTTAPDDVLACMRRLFDEGVLARHALVSYEHAKRDDTVIGDISATLSFDCAFHKIYGDTSIHIFTMSTENDG